MNLCIYYVKHGIFKYISTTIWLNLVNYHMHDLIFLDKSIFTLSIFQDSVIQSSKTFIMLYNQCFVFILYFDQFLNIIHILKSHFSEAV